MNGTTEEFYCLKCGWSVAIDLSDEEGEEKAEAAHRKYDGAHYGNFLTEVDGEIYCPSDLRELRGIELPEGEEW